MLIRLQKFMADSGLASRRKSEEFINAGLVSVNGNPAKIGDKVDPEKDTVKYLGRTIGKTEKKVIVIMLNKPAGFTCTTRKFKGERNIFELINIPERVYPVGRLDKDSEGLILLTNDGELAQRLTHPKFEKEKEYFVTVNKNLRNESLSAMENGIQLEDGKTLPTKVKKFADKSFSIILKEGKKRQIRRMCEKMGLEVEELKRVRVNKLKLGELKTGKYVVLSEAERTLL